MILNHVDQFDNILVENVYIEMQQKEIKMTFFFSEITHKIILWIKEPNTEDLRHRRMMRVNAHWALICLGELLL